jgi:hypothetical protein
VSWRVVGSSGHSRNLGEPINNRPFTRLLGSTSCGNRPVRRANFIKQVREFLGREPPKRPSVTTTGTTGSYGESKTRRPSAALRAPAGSVVATRAPRTEDHASARSAAADQARKPVHSKSSRTCVIWPGLRLRALISVVGSLRTSPVFKHRRGFHRARRPRSAIALRPKVRWFEHSHVSPVGRTTRTYRTDRGSPLNTSHTPIVSSKTKIGPP